MEVLKPLKIIYARTTLNPIYDKTLIAHFNNRMVNLLRTFYSFKNYSQIENERRGRDAA